MEAQGIENELRLMSDTIEQEKCSIGVRGVSASAPDRASKCAIDRGDVTAGGDAYELSNVVETALARALLLAAEAKRWDVLMAIAAELRRAPTSYFLDGDSGELGLMRTTRPSST